jgi:hypothetical protein
MNLFLPREIGSVETGPQLFAGTIVPNTTFIFTTSPEIPDAPGLTNSVLIQNAGRNSLNGIFDYSFELEGKPYYNKNGISNLFIVWFENEWGIYDFTISGDPIYYSSENVLYPWNVTNWLASNSIYNPIPSVTKVL